MLRGERGQAGGFEVLPFSLLVFVAGALLVTNLWAVVDTKLATDAASREAVRHIAESARVDVDPAAIRSAAADIAARTLEDHGRGEPSSVVVHPAGSTFERCDRIEVTVSAEVPAIRIPFVGGYGNPFTITATHSELIDPTRSGVSGRADCIR